MRRLVALAASALLLAVVVGTSGASTESTLALSRRLGNSGDVTLAAIDLSHGAWSNGAATVVALGRDDVFADALAGDALAGTHGPILYTTGGASAPLRPETLTEIQRVLPSPTGCGGAGRVYLLGGTAAISPAAEGQLTNLNYCVVRFGGVNRVDTAVQIGRYVRDHGGDASEILLSRADNWPDAATGGAYAARTGHPIVVTWTDRLDPEVASFLDESNPATITLLGGSAALAPAVESASGAYGSTRRVQGASRDETATAIARTLWGPLTPQGVMLVNGFTDTGWAYAIAGAVNAAVDGAAELYVQAAFQPPSVRDYLLGTNYEFVVADGPPDAVSDFIFDRVKNNRAWEDLTPIGSAPLRYRDQVFNSVTTTPDINYRTATNSQGQSVTLAMDLYEPAGDSVMSRPAVVYVHGGGFHAGDRKTLDNLDELEGLAKEGYVVASIDYRLVPAPGCETRPITDSCKEGIVEAREDAQAAVAFLRTNASTYHLDPTRIAIAGTSAGGVTALNVGYSSSETPSGAVRAAVANAGAAIGVPITGGDAPALLFNGTEDAEVPYSQAQDTVVVARFNGLCALLVTFEGVGHNVYGAAPAQILTQTTNFLWWQMQMWAAAT